MFQMPDGSIRLLAQGLSRIKLNSITQKLPYLKGSIEKLNEVKETSIEVEALVRSGLENFQYFL